MDGTFVKEIPNIDAIEARWDLERWEKESWQEHEDEEIIGQIDGDEEIIDESDAEQKKKCWNKLGECFGGLACIACLYGVARMIGG